jgi:hypothetical protein
MGKKGLTRQEVITFCNIQILKKAQVIFAIINNGSTELNITEKKMTSLIKSLHFDGEVSPCRNIIECEVFESTDIVYQFSSDDGLKIQIVTY